MKSSLYPNLGPLPTKLRRLIYVNSLPRYLPKDPAAQQQVIRQNRKAGVQGLVDVAQSEG